MSDTPILRALSAAVGVADTAPDGELLRRFAEVEDRTAFELVVRRHAELVWGVCRAALPRDTHAAEDAFQATFLILARKATTVRDGSAAGWLFRVARNVAVRARGRAARQDMRPLPDSLATASESAEDEAARHEVVPVVAEEVDRLTATLRDPVVLCFFEGHTHAEAAERLGWPIGTVASRLARAKDVLRDRLTRRGVILPAGGLAAVLTATQSATAAPAALVRAAIANTAGPVKTIAPAVRSLTEGALSAMQFAKLKALAAVAIVAIGVTAALAAVPLKESADRVATAPSGLIAVEVARSARAADDKDDKAAKELERKELKQLQGKWRVVKQKVDDKELPPEELIKWRMAIENSVMTFGNGDPKKDQQWMIKLSPSKSPKEISSTVLSGQFVPKGTTNSGTYKLDDDKLTMDFVVPLPALNGDPPNEFKADKAVTLAVAFTFERVKEEKEELAALAGEWKGVSLTVSGREIPAEQAAKAKWLFKDAEILLTEEEEKASIKLDPAAVPPTIELTITTGPEGEKGNVLRGIYFRQADKLYLAFRDPKTKKDDRPTELKAGDDVAFIVFEREPKK